jgi:hypothetical protein
LGLINGQPKRMKISRVAKKPVYWPSNAQGQMIGSEIVA